MLQIAMRAEAFDMTPRHKAKPDSLAQLEALLAPPDLSDVDRPLDRARANRRAATAATSEAEAALLAATQLYGAGKNIAGSFTEPREVIAARLHLARAKADEEKAKAAFVEAQAFRDHA